MAPKHNKYPFVNWMFFFCKNSSFEIEFEPSLSESQMQHIIKTPGVVFAKLHLLRNLRM
jgi:hypothetical protein